jgi:hypothetical protein
MGSSRCATLRPLFRISTSSALLIFIRRPFWAARPGTTHGYDVCDHSRINPQLGGDAGLAELAAQLQSHQFGYILDFVPNHMSIDFSKTGVLPRSPTISISIGNQ